MVHKAQNSCRKPKIKTSSNVGGTQIKYTGAVEFFGQLFFSAKLVFSASSDNPLWSLQMEVEVPQWANGDT